MDALGLKLSKDTFRPAGNDPIEFVQQRAAAVVRSNQQRQSAAVGLYADYVEAVVVEENRRAADYVLAFSRLRTFSKPRFMSAPTRCQSPCIASAPPGFG
jgi:hypothetical protein